MLLTEEYKEQQKSLHNAGSYGVSSGKWSLAVTQLADSLKTRDVLDYGCGQRMLEKALDFPIRNYDPCIPGLDEAPEPADIVVCTDVLEHIEPDCIDAVLDDLERVTLKAGFFVVCNRPAKKILPDGRNAHLIQADARYWLPKIMQRFQLRQFQQVKHDLVIVVIHA
jgi:hypothetical protein